MTIGRNEPCPCDSGSKYKRCCGARVGHDLRLVGRLEREADELGTQWRQEEPLGHATAMQDMYGPMRGFGVFGPERGAVLECRLWALADRRDVGSPALRSSVHRLWRVAAVCDGGYVRAVDPLDGTGATLLLPRPPHGELVVGRLLVACSLELAEGRWVALGEPVVVDEEAEDDVMALVAARAGEGTNDPWRRVGGELAAAAWCWPIYREHVVEGDEVCSAHVVFGVDDLDATLDALEDAGQVRADDRELWSDSECWRFVLVEDGDALVSGRAPAAAPGERWRLCRQDRAEPRILADVEVCLDDETDAPELSVWAPTPGRLAVAEAALSGALGRQLGRVEDRGEEEEDPSPRWHRDRLRRLMPGFERALALG